MNLTLQNHAPGTLFVSHDLTNAMALVQGSAATLPAGSYVVTSTNGSGWSQSLEVLGGRSYVATACQTGLLVTSRPTADAMFAMGWVWCAPVMITIMLWRWLRAGMVGAD